LVGTAAAQCPIVEQAHVFASDGSPADTFGRGVAVDGNTMVIGSHNDDTPAADLVGSAYVFEYIDGAWVETAHLLAPDGAYLHTFGFSVAISGDTIVVGAQNNGPGSVYVFVRNAGSWTLQAQLFASDGAFRDDFGSAVAVSGDTIVVGAREDHIGIFEEVGSAYVFVRNGGVWTELTHIIVNSVEYGQFASAVGIDGDTLVLGPFKDNCTGAPLGGGALVYVRNGSVWMQEAVLSAPGGMNGDGFGRSVAIDGDTIVVGATNDATPGGTGAGSASVFVRNGSTWSWQGQLLAADGAPNDFFGTSVSVFGETAVVGAFFDDTAAGANAGSAYVYTRSGGIWTQAQRLSASDTSANDYFGAGVAISDGTVVVGAYADDTPAGMNAGSAYIFSPASGGSGDLDGDGVIDACDGCPADANKTSPGACGCGIADTDSDGDGTPDCLDGCPSDPGKTAPGICGCGTADIDSDNDTVLNCNDVCPGGDDRLDCDDDGTPDSCDPDGCEDEAIILMAFNTTTNVPGVGNVADEDIVAYDTGTQTWSLYFDGGDVELASFAIDALARLPNGNLVFSFAAAGTVGGVVSDDSDLLRFTPTSLGATTAGTWTMYFDGSDVGLTTNAEDIDAVSVLADGRILISTEGSVSVTGASGIDSDILVFTPTSLGAATAGTWTVYFDGSDVGLQATNSGEDIDALCVTPLGALLLSTVDAFGVPGVSGADEDVFEFTPSSLGSTTAGMYQMYLDLSAVGITTDVVGLELVP